MREHGYVWGEPHVNDDVCQEYMREHIDAFVEAYLKACVFMSRTGNRSQLGNRHVALNQWNRTLAQQQAHVEKKRCREEVLVAQADAAQARRAGGCHSCADCALQKQLSDA